MNVKKIQYIINYLLSIFVAIHYSKLIILKLVNII